MRIWLRWQHMWDNHRPGSRCSFLMRLCNSPRSHLSPPRTRPWRPQALRPRRGGRRRRPLRSPAGTARARSSTGHVLAPQNRSRLAQTRRSRGTTGRGTRPVARPRQRRSGPDAVLARPALALCSSQQRPAFRSLGVWGGLMLPPALGLVPVCFQPAADAVLAAVTMGSGTYRTPSQGTRGQRRLPEVE